MQFQRIAKRDKKAFLSNQYKEIEENKRMGKTRGFFKKIRDIKGTYLHMYIYIQFSSVIQSSSTLCDPMNCSTPGLPVHHQLLEFIQTRWT